MKLFKVMLAAFVLWSGFLSPAIFAATNDEPAIFPDDDDDDDSEEVAVDNPQPYPNFNTPMQQMPVGPAPMQQIPVGPSPSPAQSAQTALGFSTSYVNNNLNYPAVDVFKDPRYRALGANQMLIDAIKFGDIKSNKMFLILFPIKKGPNNTPVVGVMKAPIVQITNLQGIVFVHPHTQQLKYYSGFLMQSPAWKSLYPGQSLVDSFCKIPNLAAPCSAENTVNIVLNKSDDPMKNLPSVWPQP